MVKVRPSTKRVLTDKANSTMVAITAVAAFIVVFALIATKTLVSQAAYQNRVIAAKKTALNQLKTDVQSTDSLVASYKAFVGTPQNVLGGDPQGTGPQDGDNAKIVLDALPSKYDFPALLTSVQKLLAGQGVQIQAITGNDDEVAQATNQGSASPAPIAMPFQVSVEGNYQQIQNTINAFGKSIRPFQIQTMAISGDQKSMTLTLSLQTYYQPEKTFSITKEAVK